MNKSERDKKILDNIGLVHYIINLYPIQDKEEALSYGIIGLITAVDKYDESFGTKFSTYAQYHIKNELFQFFSKNHFLTSLDEPIDEDRTILDTIESTDDLELDIIETDLYNYRRKIVKQFLEDLPVLDKDLYSSYLTGLNVKDLSKKFKLRVDTVNQKLNKIERKFRNEQVFETGY